jgi:hypothetical protein
MAKFLKFIILDPSYIIFKRKDNEEIKILVDMHKYTDYIFNIVKEKNALNQSTLKCKTSIGDDVDIQTYNFDKIVCDVSNQKTNYSIIIHY